MRIKEILLDKFISTRLFEMAADRHTAKNKVSSLSPQIFDHLLKIWVLDIPQSSPHWRAEINAWLNQIDKIYLKTTKKKISYTDLYNWMIIDASPHYCEEYIDHTVKKWIKTDYSNSSVREYDANVVLNQILDVINKVCKDISINNFFSINDYLEIKS